MSPRSPTIGDTRGSRTSSGPLFRVQITACSTDRETTEATPLLPRTEGYHDSRIRAWRASLDEIWTILSYAVPVISTNFLEYSLVVATVVSLGHLSTVALAASSLASMTASVSGLSIVYGLVSALDSLLPQAWTSSNPQLVGLWSQRMMVVISATIIPILIVWHKAEPILLLLGQEPEVARLAGLYLKWSSFELHAFAFNNISRRYYQSQGLVRVPTMIIMIVAPINAFLQWLLVWGPDPVRLGFIGAPIASAISMNLISLLSIGYGVFFTPRTAWSPISSQCFTGLGVLVRLGIGGVGQTASEWWSFDLIALAASMLGPLALACQSVLLIMSTVSWQLHSSLGIASSIRIGNLIGSGDSKRAGFAARISLALAVALAFVISSLLMIFRKSWARLFNNDAEVVSRVAHVMPLLALFQVFDAINSISGGVLRARGKQFVGAVLNVTAYYVVGIPFGLLLTFHFKMGLSGIWIGISVALAYAAFIGVWLLLRTDWEQEVMRARERITAGQKTERRDPECPEANGEYIS
ncbi:hypothetical protein BOTBODRAFT_39663 [Botryobasidium botryosum FD-172 SS1]|uniref:MATE efflux family protein n=1 Tax=Botryobasidium botryosum (strain FD-172 SS1) TaxID=930990 RepID=A0A067LVQ4_BOTB1|nr:hypothetical protein BOTBODRAFT_39663 [Botryobasidium botryosum FD-172 SS1]